MLTDDDRRLGHKLAAGWLEAHGESDPRLLAEHYERGGSPRNAARWLLRAAERLLGEGSPAEALDCAHRADELGLSPRTERYLIRVLTHANRSLGRYEDTLAWLRARRDRPMDAVTRAAVLEAEIATLRSLDATAVLERADEALAAVESVGDLDARACILSHATFAAYRAGRADLARDLAARADDDLQSTDWARLHVLRARLFAAAAAEDKRGCAELSRQILELALQTSELALASNECNNLAEALLDLGRPEEALVTADRGLELAEMAGFRAVASLARSLRAAALAETDQLDLAIDTLRANEVVQATSVQVDHAVMIATYLLDRGRPEDLDDVIATAEPAIAVAQKGGIKHAVAGLLAACAIARHRRGDPGGAAGALAGARRHADVADLASEIQTALAILELEGPAAAEAAIVRARDRLRAVAARSGGGEQLTTGRRLYRRLLAAAAAWSPP